MAQEDNKIRKQKYGRLRSAFSLISFGLVIFGVFFCIIFICTGIVGVIRGYSVRSVFLDWFPVWLMGSFGVCMLHEAIPSLSSKYYGTASIFFLVIFLYCVGLSALQRGQHLVRGNEYYKQEAYQQAIEEFKKETETWYLRLKYNIDEDTAMYMLAKSYRKVEDFDNARNTYKIIIDRYTGYYAEDAKKNLASIENAL